VIGVLITYFAILNKFLGMNISISHLKIIVIRKI